MAKTCYICAKSLGLFSEKYKTDKGPLCSKCIQSVYSQTKKVGMYFSVDEDKKMFMVDHDLFTYEQLLDYELLEDGNSVAKGGLGRAIAGGVLLGPVGAIVGGVTGKKKSKSTCTSMKLRITLKEAHCDTVYITFVRSEIKVNSMAYRSAQSSAQSCISALEIILDSKKTQANAGYSTADEILKLQQLTEKGILTKEEFEAKKKQLLGI